MGSRSTSGKDGTEQDRSGTGVLVLDTSDGSIASSTPGSRRTLIFPKSDTPHRKSEPALRDLAHRKLDTHRSSSRIALGRPASANFRVVPRPSIPPGRFRLRSEPGRQDVKDLPEAIRPNVVSPPRPPAVAPLPPAVAPLPPAPSPRPSEYSTVPSPLTKGVAQDSSAKLLRGGGGTSNGDRAREPRPKFMGSVFESKKAGSSAKLLKKFFGAKDGELDSSAKLLKEFFEPKEGRGSSDEYVQLSASDLESERHRSIGSPLIEHALTELATNTTVPPGVEVPLPFGSAEPPASRRSATKLLFSHVVVAVIALAVVGFGRPKSGGVILREPNVPLPERTPRASVPVVPLPPPPSGGCAPAGDVRLLASHAQVGPGLDVNVLETGFGVALASGAKEAVGLRVEGSGLRVAEVVRVKTSSIVSHAVVDVGVEQDGESLDVRVDEPEARTIVAGDGPPFRIVSRGGAILALLDDLRGERSRVLWSLPGAPPSKPPAPAASLAQKFAHPSKAPRAKSDLYRPSSLSADSSAKSALPSARPSAASSRPEALRAVGRDDGAVVVAFRRGATLWFGGTDASLEPTGPLASLARKGMTVGNPAVAPWGGGGAVAWAERALGDREWKIAVAGFTPDGEGATLIGPVRVIGTGMSPTIAALPDGDLLLAHADGAPGAHRVVARRLGRDLSPRGDELVVSPESVNAGQPVVAVRPDGRAIIAFFAADRGRPASVLAAPLSCDPGF